MGRADFGADVDKLADNLVLWERESLLKMARSAGRLIQ
jgi:hypothetical protein